MLLLVSVLVVTREGDCNSNVCSCAGAGGGEAAEQVSCNAV